MPTIGSGSKKSYGSVNFSDNHEESKRLLSDEEDHDAPPGALVEIERGVVKIVARAKCIPVLKRVASALLMTIMTMGVGAFCFHQFENTTKADGTVKYEYSWMESLHFIIVSSSTVGYGWIVPTSDATRVFVIVYVFFGISVVVTILGVLYADVDHIMARHDAYEASKDYHLDTTIASRFIKVVVQVIYQLLYVCCVAAAGACFFAFEESRPILDGLYFAIETLTTVGYGDIFSLHKRQDWHPTTELFALLFIVVGIPLYGGLVSRLVLVIRNFRVEHQLRLRVRSLLDDDMRALALGDCGHDSELEFIIRALCLVPEFDVNVEDIALVVDLFGELDVMKENSLSHQDLITLFDSDAYKRFIKPQIRRKLIEHYKDCFPEEYAGLRAEDEKKKELKGRAPMLGTRGKKASMADLKALTSKSHRNLDHLTEEDENTIIKREAEVTRNLEAVMTELRLHAVATATADTPLEDHHKDFLHFDTSGDDALDADEFKAFLAQIDPCITDDHVAAMFKRFDLNSDGKLTWEEFEKSNGRRMGDDAVRSECCGLCMCKTRGNIWIHVLHLIRSLSILAMLLSCGICIMAVVEKRSFLDSAHFAVVTATTIGYGQVIAMSSMGRMLTCVYMLLSVNVLGSLFDEIIVEFASVVGKPHKMAAQGNYVHAAWHFLYKLGGVAFLMLLGTLAYFFMNEGTASPTVIRSAYFTMQTITTIGYGDTFTLTNLPEATRVFSLVFMLIGVAVYSSILLRWARLVITIRNFHILTSFIEEGLAWGEVHEMDGKSGTQSITRAHFVVYMLVKLHFATVTDIAAIIATYHQLQHAAHGRVKEKKAVHKLRAFGISHRMGLGKLQEPEAKGSPEAKVDVVVVDNKSKPPAVAGAKAESKDETATEAEAGAEAEASAVPGEAAAVPSDAVVDKSEVEKKAEEEEDVAVAESKDETPPPAAPDGGDEEGGEPAAEEG